MSAKEEMGKPFFDFKEHVRDICIKELCEDVSLLQGDDKEKDKENSWECDALWV